MAEKIIKSSLRLPVDAQKIIDKIKKKTHESKNAVIVRLILEKGDQV